MTEVVNINRTDDYDVYIGRPGKGKDGYFGNPFIKGTRAEKLEKFEQYANSRVNSDPKFRDKVKSLYGKKLGCFCKPKACHGDILAKIAKRLHEEDNLLDY
jgi:hypothetical protein